MNPLSKAPILSLPYFSDGCFCLMAYQLLCVIWYQTHRCYRTGIAIKSITDGDKEVHDFCEIISPVSLRYSLTGVRTLLLRCCSLTRLSQQPTYFSECQTSGWLGKWKLSNRRPKNKGTLVQSPHPRKSPDSSLYLSTSPYICVPIHVPVCKYLSTYPFVNECMCIRVCYDSPYICVSMLVSLMKTLHDFCLNTILLIEWLWTKLYTPQSYDALVLSISILSVPFLLQIFFYSHWTLYKFVYILDNIMICYLESFKQISQ